VLTLSLIKIKVLKIYKALPLALLGLSYAAFGQIPPCGNDYGNASDETTISAQMRYGTIIDAVNAINQAKNTRGASLGCPQVVVSYGVPDITEPLLSTIENVWTSVHAPAIEAYSVSCPRIGRYENNAGLGAYYAMQAGYFTNTNKLAEIADMMYDQQYATWNIDNPTQRNEGVYGYLNVASNENCYIGGVVGSSVTILCTALPQYCLTYTSGQFAGLNFAISGQDDNSNSFDGGLAYDHGWVGVLMIESAIMQTDPSLKQKYKNSLLLAGQYAISEYAVKNHNYTAKLIWLLAELYAWTGDAFYKDELNLKLDKNLLPGILWDADNNGMVDGTSPAIPFSSLTVTAQTPGRMWDGHNSLPWYHAMNAWALTEAYVAFRDQGDDTRANELKPYVIAMLDNLANEIAIQGIISPDALGVRDITYALLIGIWKISKYENEPHVIWEQAAWAMWNSGYFNTYSTHSVCVGLFLLVKSNTIYKPLATRDDFVLSVDGPISEEISINIYPNPSGNILKIDFVNRAMQESKFIITNSKGKQVMKGFIGNDSSQIDIRALPNGVYILTIFEHEKVIPSLKFIKD